MHILLSEYNKITYFVYLVFINSTTRRDENVSCDRFVFLNNMKSRQVLHGVKTKKTFLCIYQKTKIKNEGRRNKQL